MSVNLVCPEGLPDVHDRQRAFCTYGRVNMLYMSVGVNKGMGLWYLQAVDLLNTYFITFLVPENIRIDTKFMFVSCLEVMHKMGNGSHFGRHLGFPRLHKRDTRGLLVCHSVHVPASILKK